MLAPFGAGVTGNPLELRFDGEVAIVTGGGRGIGSTHAQMLAARGCRVVVNDVGVGRGGEPSDDRPATEVVRAIVAAGGEAIVDEHSVVDQGASIVEHAMDQFGRLDIVVNNAGNLGRSPFADVPPEQFELVIGTHVRGSFAVTQAAFPHLAAAGGGRVLFTSSTATWGAPGSIAYSVAKSALIGLTNTLALEGAAVGIRTNAIMPSAWTRLTSDTPQADISSFVHEFLAPEYVSAFVTWLVHRDTTLNGQVFSVGGGRAGRVLLVETPGVNVASQVPEDWAGREQQLLVAQDHAVPSSMVDELGFQAASLGGSAAEGWAQLQQRS
jgi:NAD(P)-dependent dehydrogenase (short-subunit alcohol dehydrogenase family)